MRCRPGDPVLAENYLQHAEHYNRIILGYREQMAQQGGMIRSAYGAARTHTLAGPDGTTATNSATTTVTSSAFSCSNRSEDRATASRIAAAFSTAAAQFR